MMLQDEKAPSVFMMRKKDQVVLFDHFEKNGPKSESIPYPYTKKRKS